MSIEPILNEENRRFTLFPIQYPEIWELYQKQLASFWRAEEIDMSKDFQDFERLKPDEQFYIKRVLAFFAASDGIVNFNLSTRFLQDIKILEAQICYQYQMFNENIHSLTYSLMLDNIIKDATEKDSLFNAIRTVPSIQLMADWAFKWIHSDKTFAHRVVAFCVVEGVLFSGMFASIFWLKQFHGTVMNGLLKSNEFIAKDECSHTYFGCMLYRMLEHTKLSQSDAYEIVDEGVKISQNFMTEALPCNLLGMNADSMCQYIEYVGDMLLVDLGYQKKYNVTNPFDFMVKIGLHNKANFFESRVTAYSAAYGQGRVRGDLKILDDF